LKDIVVTDIWVEFLKIVKEEAGSRVVETWFKAVCLHRWDPHEKVVHLQAPNAFVQDWIKSNYLSLIELHLKRLLSVDQLRIVFVGATPVMEAQLTDPVSASLPTTSVTSSNTEQKIVPAQALTHKKINGYRSYSFDSFVVGPNNSLAYAAAQAVAEKPGLIYNPLFIYGGSGLGKTHLLHAIGNHLRMQEKKAIVLYQTADRFVNEFIHAIRFDKVHQFQSKYKSVDVLLIDDIQFISNKEQTQEAFFHIFNTLHDAEKQIVFSSDAFPHDISGIADRLKYRLSWGLVVDMHVPTLETKIAILKKKAETNGEPLSDEVAHFIATRVVSNVRELEGSLIRVMAFAALTKQPITMELVQKVLIRSPEPAQTHVGLERIVKCVNKYYPYDLNDLRSKNRSREVTFARQITMFLIKKVTDKSLRDIGIFLGGRDHSTVMHALDKVQMQAQENPEFSHQLKKIEEEILRSV
jgi:chromosomal replication initiator protein